ncbi:uncharacterized protein TNCV_4685721 [Trichonephila clavipes]|nr:uncharacterized protein TNCV_4685721 [Trichonephila clavipes]
MACEIKLLESEATTGFFVLLGEQGNKAVLDWVMKEGLIPSRYECPKCKKDMRLVERKGTIDGFEWRCRVQSKENPHFVCRSVRKGRKSLTHVYKICNIACCEDISRDSRFGRRASMTSIESWSERTEQSSSQTNTAGLGAISPSRICFGDTLAENSNLFRETIVARNVYAAWARKLTTAKPDDPDLQNIHLEVGKSGEIVSNLLAKLNIPLFKIPAYEKELDRIIFRLKSKKIEPSPVKNQEAKKPAAVSPPLPAPRTERRREASIPMAGREANFKRVHSPQAARS